MQWRKKNFFSATSLGKCSEVPFFLAPQKGCVTVGRCGLSHLENFTQ